MPDRARPILKERTAGRHAAARVPQGAWRRGTRAACEVGPASSTSAPAPAFSPSPRRKRCVGRCSRATSIGARSPLRVRTRDQSRRPPHRGHPCRRIVRTEVPAAWPATCSILANILLEPLQQLATPIARLLSPGGLVVLSGLLAAQSGGARELLRARPRGRAPRHRGVGDLVLMRPRRPADRRGRNRSPVRRRR